MAHLKGRLEWKMLAHSAPALVSGYGNAAAGVSGLLASSDLSLKRLRYELNRLRLACHLRLALVNATLCLIPCSALTTVRAAVYRLIGFRIGSKVAFMSTIHVTGDGPEVYNRLQIGDGCFIGTNAMFNLSDNVVIGRNVSVGPYVRIYTSTHEIGPPARRRSYTVDAKPVTIDDGAWICVGVTVLPGVHIGAGSIIAAGSVVTHDVEPNTLVSGVPATCVRALSPTYGD